MSAVASIAGFMKRHVVGPSLIRRNPFFYDRARAILEEGERQDLAQRRAWSEAQVKRTLQFARRTEYGRRVDGGESLQSWPFLEKESLRDLQRDFIAGTSWLSAPASTGGTTGVPLSLVRSRQHLPGHGVARVLHHPGLQARHRTLRHPRGQRGHGGLCVTTASLRCHGQGRRYSGPPAMISNSSRRFCW